MKLLPCPFCGNTNPFVAWDKAFGTRLAEIRCGLNGCEARGSYENTEAEAIKRWNTRSDSDAVREACEIIKSLASYTEACEGLLNCTTAGQVKAARAFLARYDQKGTIHD